MTHENGYYWVKFRNWWQIAELNNGYIFFAGDETDVRLDRVEIGDKIETPEKYKNKE
jgi:hypothetical protein